MFAPPNEQIMDQISPKPVIGLTSLDDALTNQNSSGKPIKTFVGYNSGSRTFSLIMSLFEVQEYTEVANDRSSGEVAQRKLDMPHAIGIGRYILKGLLHAAQRTREKQGKPVTPEMESIIKTIGKQPYISIPPLVASFRESGANGTNLKVLPLLTSGDETASYKIFLNHGDVFWVVDGQHRRKGIQLVFDFLDAVRTNRRYPAQRSLFPEKSKEDLSSAELQVWEDVLAETKKCTLTLEVHLGLDIEQERQLFHDLNNLAKKVEKGLAFQFDGSNPINVYVKEVLKEGIFEDYGYQVSMSDKVNWNDSGSGLTWKDLIGINALLFLNKTTVHGAKPIEVEERQEKATEYWSIIPELKGTTADDAKQQTVLAQPVVLKALAKLWFDFHFGRNVQWRTPENQRTLAEGIRAIDFSHSNPMWRYYELTETERSSHGLDGLSEYMPSDKEGVNRDLGMYDPHTKVFRFGAKHNDIYPLIGDMIRWKLDLPARQKVAQLQFDNV